MLQYREAQKTYNIVEIYCDRCKKLIAESEEYDDGYIPTPIEVCETDPMFTGFDKHIELPRMILCEDCCKECGELIENFLKNFDFTKEGA